METTISPYELPPGRARRVLLHAQHVPLERTDLSYEEQVDLLAGLQRLREAILAERASAA